MNQAMILGRVGQEPTVRDLSEGRKVANFSVATSEKWTKTDGSKGEKTCWHRVTVWGGLVDIVKTRVTKGCEVFVVGKIDNSTYEKDGQKVNKSEIVVQGPGTFFRVMANAGAAKPAERSDHEEKADKLEDSIPF